MVSFNLPLQPSDFHLQHVSLSKNISLHTISNLILLSHLSDFFFLITKFIGKVVIFMSLFPSYSPISFSQKEPVPSNWIILFKVLKNLRFLQESLSSTIISSDMVHAPSVFQFSLPLTSLILHDIFFLFFQAIFFLLFISYFLSLLPVT